MDHELLVHVVFLMFDLNAQVLQISDNDCSRLLIPSTSPLYDLPVNKLLIYDVCNQKQCIVLMV